MRSKLAGVGVVDVALLVHTGEAVAALLTKNKIPDARLS
jgi:hypothetical protein